MHTVEAPSQAVGSAFAALNPPVCCHRAAVPADSVLQLVGEQNSLEFVDVWMVDRSPYLTQSEMLAAGEALARLRNAPVDVKRVEIPLATFRHVATIMPTEAAEPDDLWQTPDHQAVVACSVAADRLSEGFELALPPNAIDRWWAEISPPDGAPEWGELCPVESLNALKISLERDLRIPFHGRPEGQHLYEAVALALEAEAEQLRAFADQARLLAEERKERVA